MASNDQWPPVSSAASAKASAKSNGNKRHIMKDEQQEILKKLDEMFGSTLEPGVILSVVMNCNWKCEFFYMMKQFFSPTHVDVVIIGQLFSSARVDRGAHNAQRDSGRSADVERLGFQSGKRWGL